MVLERGGRGPIWRQCFIRVTPRTLSLTLLTRLPADLPATPSSFAWQLLGGQEMQIGGAGDTNYRREGQWAANISSGAQNCRWCQISDEGVTKSRVFWLKEDSRHKLDNRLQEGRGTSVQRQLLPVKPTLCLHLGFFGVTRRS